MAAECFHCRTGNPVGVCNRCNVLVCATDGTRPNQFECISCGSAQAAAGAVVRSGQDSLNRLSDSLVREALLPGESREELGRITLDLLIFSGLRLRRTPGDVEPQSPGQTRESVAMLRRDIDGMAKIWFSEERGPLLDRRLPRDVLTVAGADSGADAVRQAVDLWGRLDEPSKSTLAAALLMHRASHPHSWPTAVTVIRYALDPDADDLPSQPWG